MSRGSIDSGAEPTIPLGYKKLDMWIESLQPVPNPIKPHESQTMQSNNFDFQLCKKLWIENFVFIEIVSKDLRTFPSG